MAFKYNWVIMTQREFEKLKKSKPKKLIKKSNVWRKIRFIENLELYWWKVIKDLDWDRVEALVSSQRITAKWDTFKKILNIKDIRYEK